MPQAYHSPSSYQQFKTTTLLYSAGSLFGTKGVKKTDLKAGAALLAEGTTVNAVYWSKPADFNVVEGKPLPNFWGSEATVRCTSSSPTAASASSPRTRPTTSSCARWPNPAGPSCRRSTR